MRRIRMLRKAHDLDEINDMLGRGWVILCMVEDERRGYPPSFILGAPAVVAEDEMQLQYQGESNEN